MTLEIIKRILNPHVSSENQVRSKGRISLSGAFSLRGLYLYHIECPDAIWIILMCSIHVSAVAASPRRPFPLLTIYWCGYPHRLRRRTALLIHTTHGSPDRDEWQCTQTRKNLSFSPFRPFICAKPRTNMTASKANRASTALLFLFSSRFPYPPLVKDRSVEKNPKGGKENKTTAPPAQKGNHNDQA